MRAPQQPPHCRGRGGELVSRCSRAHADLATGTAAEAERPRTSPSARCTRWYQRPAPRARASTHCPANQAAAAAASPRPAMTLEARRSNHSWRTIGGTGYRGNDRSAERMQLAPGCTRERRRHNHLGAQRCAACACACTIACTRRRPARRCEPRAWRGAARCITPEQQRSAAGAQQQRQRAFRMPACRCHRSWPHVVPACTQLALGGCCRQHREPAGAGQRSRNACASGRFRIHGCKWLWSAAPAAGGLATMAAAVRPCSRPRECAATARPLHTHINLHSVGRAAATRR